MIKVSPKLTEEQRNAMLQNLTAVGLSKAIGYLPLYTIKKLLRLTPEALADAAAKQGLVAVQFAPAACCIKSGALFVYHRQVLADLLQANAAAVRAAALSLDPDEFVSQIAAVWFEEQHIAYPVIAAAFGDKVL